MITLQSALTRDGQLEEVDEEPGVVLDEQLGEVVQRMMQSDASAVVARLLVWRVRSQPGGLPPPPGVMKLVIKWCIRIDI